LRYSIHPFDSSRIASITSSKNGEATNNKTDEQQNIKTRFDIGIL
jgi:hypothetical protein